MLKRRVLVLSILIVSALAEIVAGAEEPDLWQAAS